MSSRLKLLFCGIFFATVVMLFTGCTGTGLSIYNVTYTFTPLALNGATITEAHASFTMPDGSIHTSDFSDVPFITSRGGYFSGQTITMRLYGSATPTVTGAGDLRIQLSATGMSSNLEVVNLGERSYNQSAGNFDRSFIFTLP